LLESVGTILTYYIATIGYPAIFVLMLLESALIPLPSEVTMPFAGFLAGRGLFSLPIVIFIGATGNLIGSLLGYGLGYWTQETGIRAILKKYGCYVLVTTDDYDRAVRWFDTHGELIAFTSRMLPIVRTFISLPAGVARMNVLTFSTFTFIGSLIWSAILAVLGYKLGENWPVLGSYFHQFDLLFAAFFFILVLWYVYHKLGKIRRQKD
jgi:membrane protein DedA with SNARE-associated domain